MPGTARGLNTRNRVAVERSTRNPRIAIAMSKFGLIASALSIIGVLTVVSFSATADDAPTASACVHKEFKTELVKSACAKGGQAEAKTAMKAFMKEKKIKSCNVCHSKLAPKYDLKNDALEQFQKAGGK
jgi:hypothetical protein